MRKLKATLIALSLSFAASANSFTIQTGSEGGSYERAGVTIGMEIAKLADKKGLSFDFVHQNSNGTIENLECLKDGDCGLVIAQADGLNVNPVPGAKAKSLYSETVLWVYNLKNGYTDIEDIEGRKDTVMVLVDGSGAMVTMQSFAAEDDGYKVNLNSAILADDLYEAADIVAEGKYNGKKVAGLLYVGKSIPAEIATDFKGLIGVGEATDGDFNDAKDVNGQPLYKNCTINKRKLGGLDTATVFSSLDTVCVDAMVVYSTNGLERKLQKAVSKGINKAKRKL